MNFAPPSGESLAARLAKVIDAGLEAEAAQQKPREYLGGSRLGVECQRALGYEWFNTKAGISAQFAGKTHRRFRLGHMQEDETARWLRLAGFELYTHKPDGGQFGFATARDPETSEPRIKGHLDGCIVAGPLALPYPLLWEHKIMKASKWKEYSTKGVAKSHPVYFGQVQTYMAYMDLGHTLFMGWNSDTSEIWPELIPFDPACAQALTDRAVNVLQSASPEELPRITNDRTDFRCRFCDYSGRCWA